MIILLFVLIIISVCIYLVSERNKELSVCLY